MQRSICGGCDRVWYSLHECHCPSCHRQFGQINAFDAHRVGGHCVDPEDVAVLTASHSTRGQPRAHGVVWVWAVGGKAAGGWAAVHEAAQP